MASKLTQREERAEAAARTAADELSQVRKEREASVVEKTPSQHFHQTGGVHQENPQPGVIGSLIRTVQGTVGQAKDAVMGKSRDAADLTAEKTKSAKDTTAGKAGEYKDYTAEKTSETASTAAEKAKAAKDAAAQKTVEAKDTTAEKAKAAKDAAAQKAGEAKDTTAQKAGEYKDYAAQKAAETRDCTADKAKQAKDTTVQKAGEYKDFAAQKAAETGDYTAEKAKQAKDTTVEKAVEAKDYTAEKAVEGKDTTVGKMAELKDSAVDAGRRAMDFLTGKKDETKTQAVETGETVKRNTGESLGAAKEKCEDARRKMGEMKIEGERTEAHAERGSEEGKSGGGGGGGILDAIKEKLTPQPQAAEKTEEQGTRGGLCEAKGGHRLAVDKEGAPVVVKMEDTTAGAVANALKDADQMTGQTFNDVGLIGNEGVARIRLDRTGKM